MPTFTFRSPEGKTVTVTAPEGATQAEAWQVAQRQMELSHGPAQGRSTPQGVPGEVVERPVTMGQAFTAGRFRGVPEEIATKLGGEVKEVDGVLYWKPEGETAWSRLNPQGLDVTDAARTAGETLGPGGGATAARVAAQVATRNPWVRGASYVLGGGLGSAINEAVQYAEGTQRETPGQWGARAGMDAAVEGILGPVGDAAGYMLSPAVRTPSGRQATKELMEAIDFQAQNPAFPPLLPTDIMSRTGLPGTPVPGGSVSGVTKQADGMTGIISSIRRDMADTAEGALETERFVMPPTAREAAQTRLTDVARARQQGLAAEVAGLGPGAEAGAYQAEQGVRAGLGAAKGKVTGQYAGPLADAIKREKPVFNLAPVQTDWKGPTLTKTELEGMGLFSESGEEFTKEVKRQFETIPEATGRIAHLKKLLASVDTEQVNSAQAFNALKKIRTVAGDMMKSDPAFRDWKDNPAVGLYRELSTVMKNPVNRAPGYVEAFKDANLLTEWKAGFLGDNAIRKTLDTQGAAPFLRELVGDPEGILTPKFRELMDLAPEGQRKSMRLAAQQAILDSQDPVAAIDRINRASNQSPYQYLFDSDVDRKAFEQTAERMSRLYNSPMGQLFQNRGKQYDTLKFALGEVKVPAQARDLWKQMPTEDRGMIREAIIDNAVRASLQMKDGGEQVVGFKALGLKIEDLKQRGLWGLLTEEQQKRVQGMKSYYRVALSQAGDVGASLENAAVNAAMKDLIIPITPGTVGRAMEAGRTMTVNKILAKYLSNPERTKSLVNRLRRGEAGGPMVPAGIGVVLAAPFAATAVIEGGPGAVGGA